MAFLVVEGFGVREDDVRALAAGDGELRVGGGEGFAIEENVDVAAGGDGDRGGGEDFESVEVWRGRFRRRWWARTPYAGGGRE